MEIIFEKEINGVKIKVIQGDITQENTEAIVNPANNYLKHGGGVAGAIVRAGGDVIQKESDEYVQKFGPLPTGEATITSAGNLKAKYVIHTVGPRWGEGDEYKKLQKAVQSTLKLAVEKDIKTISIPAISCGIFGFPPDLGTKIIVETIVNFIKNEKHSFKEIHLIGLGEDIPNLFAKNLNSITEN
ncbi:MAG: macrodomain protein [Dictyoglomus sp. NZ13-RE01]|nr:MAG: macrodomain protein [Dictyoglomus sp. NZ13-RE01]